MTAPWSFGQHAGNDVWRDSKAAIRRWHELRCLACKAGMIVNKRLQYFVIGLRRALLRRRGAADIKNPSDRRKLAGTIAANESIDWLPDQGSNLGPAD
jgi:hypothetical protein